MYEIWAFGFCVINIDIKIIIQDGYINISIICFLFGPNVRIPPPPSRTFSYPIFCLSSPSPTRGMTFSTFKNYIPDPSSILQRINYCNITSALSVVFP